MHIAIHTAIFVAADEILQGWTGRKRSAKLFATHILLPIAVRGTTLYHSVQSHIVSLANVPAALSHTVLPVRDRSRRRREESIVSDE